MEKTILNADSHIYLYTKNWYKRGNKPFDDLRKIYAVRNGVEAKYISRSDILENVACLAYQHIKSEDKFSELITRMFRKFPYSHYTKSSSDKRVLLALLAIIGNVRTKDDKGNILVPLDKPDYTILPASH